MNLIPKEKSLNLPLACFKIEDLKFFHTGDMGPYVFPDTSKDFNSQTYALIRFQISIETDPKVQLSTFIPYAEPFTYEYMESYVREKFSEVYSLTIDNIRFQKMELKSIENNYTELVYELLVLNSKKSESLKYRSGLIIGRFQPLHKGHVYLFKKALELVDILEIGIGSSQIHGQLKNPFTYEERKKMIEDTLKDESIPTSRFNINPIPDLYNFENWIRTILEIVKNFDVIFTNNLWIGRLLQKKGKSLIYGLKYDMSNCNGTRIRNLLRSGKLEWKSLVPKSTIPFLESWVSTQ